MLTCSRTGPVQLPNVGSSIAGMGTGQSSLCKDPLEEEEAWLYDQIYQQDIALQDRLASWKIWILSSSVAIWYSASSRYGNLMRWSRAVGHS